MMIASLHKESDFDDDDVDYALVFVAAADFDDDVDGGVVGWSGSCYLYC